MTDLILSGIVRLLITVVALPVAGTLIGSAQSSPRSSETPESKEVVFSGHNLKLAGTLLLPRRQSGGEKAIGVVIVGETGPTTRNGIQVGGVEHGVYRELAESLAAQGIASLRYDRRCRGASDCRKIDSFDDYIDDLRGAVSFFAAQPGIDSKRIILIGHGEGAFLAASLISQVDDAAAGLVVTAMSGRTLGKQLRDKFQARMAEEGRSPEEIRAVTAKVERVTRPLFYNQISAVKEKFDPRDPYDAELMALLDEAPRTVSLMVNDPLQVLASGRVPVLILQGEKDLEITTKDASFLEDTLARIYHPDHTLLTLPNMDHLLRANPGKPTFASYLDASYRVDPEFLRQTGKWIRDRFGMVRR
ncbi:MAG: alpha/beta fold hydrolase [Acidobacteria bacterium]|nr:alpha/beta fold hydrolase [Acidobacteriota bacterium]